MPGHSSFVIRHSSFVILPMLALALAFSALAQPLVLRSRSGQFIVAGVPLLAPNFDSRPTAVLRLDPSVTVVSCERIKQALLESLGMADEWQDPIYISLRPVRAYNEPAHFWSIRYRDGWSYQLELPDEISGQKMVKTILQALLAELLNRSAKSSELPPWLIEGLSAHIEANELGTLMLQPDTWTLHTERKRDPLAAAREMLKSNRALSIEQLSWPSPEQAAGLDGGVYRESAHILVSELLRLPGGRDAFRRMLTGLPDDLNWQTTVLRTFSTHFQRMVDVEKWWALKTTHLAGVDKTSVWTVENSLAQLDEALETYVQVESNGFTRVPLATIAGDWNTDRARPVIEAKLATLAGVELRAAPQLAGLVKGYQAVLADHLRAPRIYYSVKEYFAPRKAAGRDTVRRLKELDAEREALRQRIKEAASDGK